MKRLFFFISILSLNLHAALEESLPQLNLLFQNMNNELRPALEKKDWYLRLYLEFAWDINGFYDLFQKGTPGYRQGEVDKMRDKLLATKNISIVKFQYYPNSAVLDFIEKIYKTYPEYQIRDLRIIQVERDNDYVVFKLKAFYDRDGAKMVTVNNFVPFLEFSLQQAKDSKLIGASVTVADFVPTYNFDNLGLMFYDRDRAIGTNDIAKLNNYLSQNPESIISGTFFVSYLPQGYKKDIAASVVIDFIPLITALY